MPGNLDCWRRLERLVDMWLHEVSNICLTSLDYQLPLHANHLFEIHACSIYHGMGISRTHDVRIVRIGGSQRAHAEMEVAIA